MKRKRKMEKGKGEKKKRNKKRRKVEKTKKSKRARKWNSLKLRKKIIKYGSVPTILNLWDINDEKNYYHKILNKSIPSFYEFISKNKYADYRDYNDYNKSKSKNKCLTIPCWRKYVKMLKTKLKKKKKLWEWNIYNLDSPTIKMNFKGERKIKRYLLDNALSIIPKPSSYKKLSSKYKILLRGMISRINMGKLTDIYIRFKHIHTNPEIIPDKKYLYVDWVFEALFGLDSNKQKRLIENESMKDPNDMFFMMINNKYCLPHDVFNIIFQYLPKGIKTLDNVGCVNENWYIMCLRCWDVTVKINENNIHRIPLLVLNNTKDIAIYNTKKKWLKRKQCILNKGLLNVKTLRLGGSGVRKTIEMFSEEFLGGIENLSVDLELDIYHNLLRCFRGLKNLKCCVSDYTMLSKHHLAIRHSLEKCKSLEGISIKTPNERYYFFEEVGSFENLFYCIPDTIKALKIDKIFGYGDLLKSKCFDRFTNLRYLDIGFMMDELIRGDVFKNLTHLTLAVFESKNYDFVGNLHHLKHLEKLTFLIHDSFEFVEHIYKLNKLSSEINMTFFFCFRLDDKLKEIKTHILRKLPCINTVNVFSK